MAKKDFKSLFFREEGNQEQKAPNPLVQQLTDAAITPISVGSSFSSVQRTGSADADFQTLVNQLKADFKQLVEDANQPGIDFLEFVKALYKSNPNPTAENYRQTFAILQVADEKLTPQFLIDAATKYKNLVTIEENKITEAGNQKKTEVESTKAKEKLSLETEQSTVKSKIERLESELQKERDRQTEIAVSLAGIDTKYQPELDKYSTQLDAVKQAAYEVRNDFVDIEAEIVRHIINNIKN